METLKLNEFYKRFEERPLEEGLEEALKVEDPVDRKMYIKVVMIIFLSKGANFIMNFVGNIDSESAADIVTIQHVSLKSDKPFDAAAHILSITKESNPKIILGVAACMAKYIVEEIKTTASKNESKTWLTL